MRGACDRTFLRMQANSRAERKALGARIQRAREKRKLTQNQLAAKIGLVDGQGVWRYESGFSVPRGDRLIKIADALGVSAEWIMTGAESDASAAASEPATADAVRGYLAADPTAKLLSPSQIAQLETVRFGEIVPCVAMVRAIALCILDGSAARHDVVTTIRRQSRER